MRFDSNAYVSLAVAGWEISLGTTGWSRARYRETYLTHEIHVWECGPLMITRDTEPGDSFLLRKAEADADMWEQVANEYHAALQTILDMDCPFGREGDLLGKAQRISSKALGDANAARTGSET